MPTERVLGSIPEIGLEFPSSPLLDAAFAYAERYCPEEVNNHVARCAYWAVLLAQRLPPDRLTTAPRGQPSSSSSSSSVGTVGTGVRPVAVEEVVLICLLHDLGLATWLLEEGDEEEDARHDSNPLPGLLSLDKRFEVDGANIARAFVQRETRGSELSQREQEQELGQEQGQGQGQGGTTTTTTVSSLASTHWDEARLDRLWTAIALHSSPSLVRHHPAPEVVLAHLAIEADFFGPYWRSPTCLTSVPQEAQETAPAPAPAPAPAAAAAQSGSEFQPPGANLITVNEYRAVTKRFPRLDFGRDGVVHKMCALCRRKPDTTYDNLVGLFGKEFLTDDDDDDDDDAAGGEDAEICGEKKKKKKKSAYRVQWETRQSPAFLLMTLDKLAAIDNDS